MCVCQMQIYLYIVKYTMCQIYNHALTGADSSKICLVIACYIHVCRNIAGLFNLGSAQKDFARKSEV